MTFLVFAARSEVLEREPDSKPFVPLHLLSTVWSTKNAGTAPVRGMVSVMGMKFEHVFNVVVVAVVASRHRLYIQ